MRSKRLESRQNNQALLDFELEFLYFPINHQPSTINHQPSTINHQPSTINHQPSTITDLNFLERKKKNKYMTYWILAF